MLNKIDRLAARTGQPPEAVVKAAVNLYEKKLGTRISPPNAELEDLWEDPENRAVFHDLMSALGKRSSKKLSLEELSARGRAGGIARRKTMSAQARKEVAKKAAEARWSKKKTDE